MQDRILIVDAIATNRIGLKVKLKKAFYHVDQAATMAEAISLSSGDLPDLIIAALALPDGGAAELCRQLAENPLTQNVPVIAMTCQPDAALRMQALEAGVHEVFATPVDEALLMGRIRSLIRSHNFAAEWRMREDTFRALGLAEAASGFEDQGHCVLVGANRVRLQSHATGLRPLMRSKFTLCSATSLMQQMADQPAPDVFVLVLSEDAEVATRECRMVSTLRASARTHNAGIIVLQQTPDSALGATALDTGADDLMTGGFDAAELALRIKAVIRRKRLGEQLRASVRTGLQAAVFDPLTGLYNRRYAMPHLERITDHAHETGRLFGVMLADLDYFKLVNDRYGHASGDAVLVEVANRLRSALRSTDMIARIGGEEFMVVMPATDLSLARAAAQRVCADISAAPFTVPGSPVPIEVTVSIGIAIGGNEAEAAAERASAGRAVLEQADRALYAAKERGRNQVKLGRPAA